MCGSPVVSACFPAASLLAIVILLLLPQEGVTIKQRLTASLIGISIIILSLLLASNLSDYSFDGNFYHQQAVADITQGWNPYDFNQLGSQTSIWIRHYGICLEIVAATIVKFTGLLESGNACNLIMVSAAMMMLYPFIREYVGRERISKWSAALVTIAIIGSPVVVCQMLTFYIDWSKYIYDIILLLAIRGVVSRKSVIDMLIMAGVIILAVATKFNIFFEACLILLLSVIWLIVERNWQATKRITIIGGISLIIALLLSYHPYLHNYIIGGSPFYPLMGASKVDIMTHNTPAIYGHGRIADFFISLFSIQLPKVDQRIGGFGPFMALILIISAWIMYKGRRGASIWLYISIMTFLSCFIFAQSWWARYICQLWIVPAVALIVAHKYQCAKIARKLLLVMMLLTTTLSLGYVAFTAVRQTLYRTELYSILQQQGDVILVNTRPQFEMHLQQHGIRPTIYEDGEKMPTGVPVMLYGFNLVMDCPPVVMLDSLHYSMLQKSLQRYHLQAMKPQEGTWLDNENVD